MDQRKKAKAVLRGRMLEFINGEAQRRMDMLVEQYWEHKRQRNTNPLVKCGEKYFSQNDEDGILLEIFRRMRLAPGGFLEFGVGNGLENNTLIALMHGWRGIWIGGEDLAFAPPNTGRLAFSQAWVTRANCFDLYADALAGLKRAAPALKRRDEKKFCDLLSLDLDGNDLYILRSLLKKGLRPAVLIVEYNGKFPPPVRWSIAYNPRHRWFGGDYQGASLQSFCDELLPLDYRLVACSLTGTNAFFVHQPRVPAGAFDDVPTEIGELFIAADYNWFVRKGHATQPETILRFLGED